MRGFKFEPYDVVELYSVEQETRGVYLFDKTRKGVKDILEGQPSTFVDESLGFLISLHFWRSSNGDLDVYNSMITNWLNTTDIVYKVRVVPFITHYNPSVLVDYIYGIDYYYWYMQESMSLVTEVYGELSYYNGTIYAVSRIIGYMTKHSPEGASYGLLQGYLKDITCLDYALNYLLSTERIYYNIETEGYKELKRLQASM